MSHIKPSLYEPKDHIKRLEIAPRAEGILDQREITIQSYQTTVPFDFKALDAGLDGAWLTPQIHFGLFARIASTIGDALNVVLALQDELTVRAYDYAERRPIWYSWQNIVLETVNVHYFKDGDGLLRFTTTGGGRRITDERLHDFNSTFLGVPKDAVSKQQFDLDKLRELCFNRFINQLFMIRFAEPSAKEYERASNMQRFRVASTSTPMWSGLRKSAPTRRSGSSHSIPTSPYFLTIWPQRSRCGSSFAA